MQAHTFTKRIYTPVTFLAGVYDLFHHLDVAPGRRPAQRRPRVRGEAYAGRYGGQSLPLLPRCASLGCPAGGCDQIGTGPLACR